MADRKAIRERKLIGSTAMVIEGIELHAQSRLVCLIICQFVIMAVDANHRYRQKGADSKPLYDMARPGEATINFCLYHRCRHDEIG